MNDTQTSWTSTSPEQLPRWLVDVESFELVDPKLASRLGELKDGGKYAIVSHRWNKSVPETDEEWRCTEVRFPKYREQFKEDNNREAFKKEMLRLQNSENVDYDDMPGLLKIARACSFAQKDSIPYVWMDTCCINKDNADEHRRELNSMFRYYRQAAVCYAFVMDVPRNGSKYREETYERKANSRNTIIHRCKLDRFEESEWFRSGWTLQELLAPRHLRFYNHSWEQFATKGSFIDRVAEATGITESDLRDDVDLVLNRTCIAVKMSWAARRKTKFLEDMAYCMLGILNIEDFDLKPGEDERAFMRLQEKLVEKEGDESIFAWVLRADPSMNHPKQYGLLAPWISCFQGLNNLTTTPNDPKLVQRRYGAGYTAVRLGIEFELPVKEWEQKQGPGFSDYEAAKITDYELGLNCWIKNEESKGNVSINIRHAEKDQPWRRERLDVLVCGSSLKPSFRDTILNVKLRTTRPQHVPNVTHDPLEANLARSLAAREPSAEPFGPIPIQSLDDISQGEKKGRLGKLFRRR